MSLVMLLETWQLPSRCLLIQTYTIPTPIRPIQLLLPVQVIKQLNVLDITLFCLHALVFFASTTSTFGNYFCYNMHAYNVISKHWQNNNYGNLSWIDSNSDCTESKQLKYRSHFCMLRIVNCAEILIFLFLFFWNILNWMSFEAPCWCLFFDWFVQWVDY